MILSYFREVSRILGTQGDFPKATNTVLRLMTDYFDLRNPLLFIYDSIENVYYLEFCPEVTDAEKNAWNRYSVKNSKLLHQLFRHPNLLYRGESTGIQFPFPRHMNREINATIIKPVASAETSLPIGVLTSFILDQNHVEQRVEVTEVTANLISMTMQLKGWNLLKVQEVRKPQTMILPGVISKSARMKEVAETVRRVASSHATVLIRGESGTGKELIAKAIHQLSLRKNAPFVSVNCAALSETLLESELFGHEKGAFTGAERMRKGRFEMADGGTLFLDEIGEISPSFQTKLLRVLQEGEFERMGGNQTLVVNVRIICATHADLERMIQVGRFRQDLYYRLKVIPIHLPALAERTEDIPHLVAHFLAKLNESYDKTVQVDEAAIQQLQALRLSGNIRELENLVHSAFVLENEGFLNLEAALNAQGAPSAYPLMPTQHSAPSLPNSSEPLPDKKVPPSPLSQNSFGLARPSLNDFEDLDWFDSESTAGSAVSTPSYSRDDEEKQLILMALKQHKGVQKRTAHYLGISKRQLEYRIKKYGITVKKLGL